MGYLTIIEISLLGFPILGLLLFVKHKNSKIYLRVLWILITILYIYYVLIAFDISIIGDMPDLIMLSLTYLTYSILVFRILLIPNKIIKIPVFIVGLLPMLFGYIISTVGVLGLMLIISGLETTNVKIIADNFEYREYSFGNSTATYGGKEFNFYEKYKLLPFENKIANIKMDYSEYDLVDLNVEFSKTNDNYRILIKSNETVQIDTLIKRSKRN